MVTGKIAQQKTPHSSYSQFKCYFEKKLGLWHAQVVSQAEAQGRVKVVALSEVQGKHFEEPTVVIAEAVGGMEDIPVQSVRASC